MAPPSSAHVQLDGVPRTLDPAKCRGIVSSTRWRGDGDGEVTLAGLPLSTTKIGTGAKTVEGGAAHG